MNKSEEYFKDICELYPTPDNDDPIVAKKMNHLTLEDVKELIDKKIQDHIKFKKQVPIATERADIFIECLLNVKTELEKLKL